MAGWIQRELSFWIPVVHERELVDHLRGREHVNVLDVHGLEDFLLEIVIQTHARGALEAETGVVDVDAVFPARAGLVDEGLRQEIVVRAAELVETQGAVVFEQFGVEEAVAESRRCGRGACAV